MSSPFFHIPPRGRYVLPHDCRFKVQAITLYHHTTLRIPFRWACGPLKLAGYRNFPRKIHAFCDAHTLDSVRSRLKSLSYDVDTDFCFFTNSIWNEFSCSSSLDSSCLPSTCCVMASLRFTQQNTTRQHVVHSWCELLETVDKASKVKNPFTLPTDRRPLLSAFRLVLSPTSVAILGASHLLSSCYAR